MVRALASAAVWASMLLLTSCIYARTRDIDLPIYPNSGFGRGGCFAGSGLLRNPSEKGSEEDPAAFTGPWLVLDSVSAEEWHTTHPTSEQRGAFLHATMLLQLDTLVWIGGSWERSVGDSIVFRELSTFPSRTRRMAVVRSGLTGTAEMVSDLVTRNPDGSIHRLVSRWPVSAARVPCEDVPKRPAGWPR
jgi:hypothetical protein